MVKTELFQGLTQAKEEFNSWQGRAVIFVDFDDMTAWCRVEEIPSYHSENIIKLVDKDDLHGRNYKIGTERLEALAQVKLDKFNTGDWTKEELSDNYFQDFSKILG